jgi:hypothetical protein
MRTAPLATLALGAMFGAASLGGVAHANGRYPATNEILFRPGDLHSFYVRSTFGLLVSHDDGCTFSWVCEQNIGFGGTFDPIYRVGSDGSIYAATLFGLTESRDGGCSFAPAVLSTGTTSRPDLAGDYVAALDIGSTGEVWAGTADTNTINAVYVSRDGGVSFQPALESSTVLFKSIAVAPSMATRIFATGYALAQPPCRYGDSIGCRPTAGSDAAVAFRSDDDGATWTPLPLAGIAVGQTPLFEVIAVDPFDPDVVFATSVGANPPVGDILYQSTDAGMTFTQVLATTSTVQDVTFTDASHAFVAQVPLMDDTGSLTPAPAYASTDGGSAFVAMTGTPQLECLSARSDGALFGCGQNWIDGKAVAQLQTDGSWSDVFQFFQLAGPLACPVNSLETSQCGPQWPALQTQFSSTGPTCGSGSGTGGGDAGPGVHASSGGCDAGRGGGPIALAGAFAAAAVSLRRRRGSRAARVE